MLQRKNIGQEKWPARDLYVNNQGSKPKLTVCDTYVNYPFCTVSANHILIVKHHTL